MRVSKYAAALVELEQIRKRDKKLRPEAVIKQARNPKSALHRHFTWSDRDAAHLHRLEEARWLIRTVYTVSVVDGRKEPAFLSLATDRQVKGGGYRSTAEIVTSDKLREMLRQTAIMELTGWIRRYKLLMELVGPVALAAKIDLVSLGIDDDLPGRKTSAKPKAAKRRRKVA